MDDAQTEQHNAQVAAIAAAYLGNPSTKVEKADLTEVIRQIDLGLRAPVTLPVAEEPEVARPTAAAIRKSITPNALISFVDGRSYKSLKRHLNAKGLTPKQYREQYGLAADYPMTAPVYSAQRSDLAKRSGLGQLAAKRREAVLVDTPVLAPEPQEEAKAPKLRRKPINTPVTAISAEVSVPEAQASPVSEVAVAPAPKPTGRRTAVTATPSVLSAEGSITAPEAPAAKAPKRAPKTGPAAKRRLAKVKFAAAAPAAHLGAPAAEAPVTPLKGKPGRKPNASSAIPAPAKSRQKPAT